MLCIFGDIALTVRNLSPAAIRSLTSQESREAWIALMTIDHPNFTVPARFANDCLLTLPIAGEYGVVSREMEFVYLPFNITLPSQDPNSTARAQISIDNVDRRIVQAVRSADSAVSVMIEIITASDPDHVEVTNPDFRLERVKYDSLTVSGEISIEYFDLEPFPNSSFTPSNFPGLF